jgi:hypothetical protein
MNHFVDSRSGGDVKDGKTPQTAFGTLQLALPTTKSGDIIYLAPGLYDLDLVKQIGAARALGLVIAVTGAH